MNIDEDYLVMMLEDMNGKFDVVVEGVGQLQDSFRTLATKDELAEVKADVQVVNTALTATNIELAKVKSDVKGIRADLADTNIELAEVKSDVKGIKRRVAALEKV